MKLKSGLYIVSTPIGNLEDITLRALNVLKNSDIILCEDTRVSKKLLAKHGIPVPLKIYNDQSDDSGRQQIKNYLAAGKVLSLISDAGTPLISDPGYKLVRELIKDGYHVDALPGACALIAALTLSGLPSDKFLFAGFIPKTAKGKENLFQELSALNATLIFFDTASRLPSTLTIAQAVFGNREAVVARELTKLYQEIKILTLSELADHYQKHSIKGEIVLLISGVSSSLGHQIVDLNNEVHLLLSVGKSAKSATDILYDRYKKSFSKSEIYQLVNKCKGDLI